jgi:homogentisate 1,2-dioxygenase
MTIYHKLGEMPRKKHTAFYKSDGSLHKEQLVSTKGFSGIYHNKYHLHAPTQVSGLKEIESLEPEKWENPPLQHFHFKTDEMERDGDFFTARIPFLENNNCRIYTAKPNKNPDYFFKNGFAHEYIFIHHGSGEFLCDLGKIRFEPGDQIIVPMATVYQMQFDKLEGNKILVVESEAPYEIPKHYRNEYGQFEEHAPYEERDFKLLEYMEPKDERGDFKVIIKKGLRLFEYSHPTHPFDVAGWDGYLYPFAFNIKDYNPKVGRIHLPPPIHLLYNTQNFVLCNFNPRPFDWHENAIPAPYYHANVDSAEVLYYVEGDFMSRKGVGEGSVTLHPLGIPHGPQPGKTEASIGKAKTDEYAIMLDTFGPLYPTINVQKCQDENYPLSWLEK